jgi:opacity protein-like surface antigen
MKKTLLATLLVTTFFSTKALAEGSDMYIGIDILKNTHSITADISRHGSNSQDVDSNSFKIKLGTVSENGWRVQGYFEVLTYDKTLFDNTNDGLMELGVDVIKGFEMTPKFTPFIQVGAGFGIMSIDDAVEESISEFSLKAGVGIAYKIVPAFELIAGADLQYRSWQDIVYYNPWGSDITRKTSESNTKLYVGGNFHF